MDDFYSKIIKSNTRKIVLLGESGSGKSELAFNFALAFVKLVDKNVHYFDMDQSKPLFRARDIKKILESNGITLHLGNQVLDTPIVPHGVENIINDENNLIIMDIGGNSTGAVNIGQYSDFLNKDNTLVFIPVNYYRPFTENRRAILKSINEIMNAAGLKKADIISNPNLGPSTAYNDVVVGHKRTSEIFQNTNFKIKLLAIEENLYNESILEIFENVVKIRPYIKTIV